MKNKVASCKLHSVPLHHQHRTKYIERKKVAVKSEEKSNVYMTEILMNISICVSTILKRKERRESLRNRN